ncbi:hypothetical protein K9K77_00475 [Candidatus Babeliales bacterium]|nr:hypothetical protein [Candidatus Babeliales bacterium]
MNMRYRYLFFLFCFSLNAYITDVVVIGKEQKKIIFLYDYHVDDKNKSESQDAVFRQLFDKVNKKYKKNALIHLETTPGPHTQKEVATYIKNNKDERCATLIELQKALFAGEKHLYSFEIQSFESRTKEDIEYSIHVPYRIAFGKDEQKNELIKHVQSWMKSAICKTKRMLKGPSYLQLFTKKNEKAVTKIFLRNLNEVQLPEKAQDVYKISSVQVDITLLTHLLTAHHQLQIVVGGRDHVSLVADILKKYKGWQHIYTQSGDDASLWGPSLIKII